MMTLAPIKRATMLDCYHQRGVWETGDILRRHERESEAGYSRRRDAFVSPALYTYLVNTLDTLFAFPPARSGYEEPYGAFLSDAGHGKTLTDLLKLAVKSAMVTGSSWLVIDSPEDQPASWEAMLAGRTFPFVQVVEATQVTEVVVDALGRLQSFAFLTGGVDYAKRYAPGRVEILDADGVIVRSYDLPEGLMPVVPIVPSGEILRSGSVPASPTLGLYQLQQGVASTFSLMDENLTQQQFSVFVVTGPDLVKDLTLGTSNALKLAEGSSASFVAPSGTPVDLMLQRISTAVSMMVKTFANLLTSSEAQSGIAKVIDRQSGVLMLKSLSVALEGVEYAIYDIFWRYLRLPASEDFTVAYYRDFDLTDLSSYLLQATEVLGLDMSPEVKREIRTEIVRKLFAGQDPEVITELVTAEQMRLHAESPADAVGGDADAVTEGGEG